MNSKPTVSELVEAARNESAADLLLENARIVDVFTGGILDSSVAVKRGRIAGIGRNYSAVETIDLKGRYLSPGFVDPHVHIESSMACVSEFARTVVARGVTTVAADPHEIANVFGAEGIRYMIESADGQPLDVRFTLPSCVPATHMETSGAAMAASDLEEFLTNDRVLALGEMMNFPGVIFRDPEVMAKLETARRFGKLVDGHAPGLSGKDLQAYVAAGISSDHECSEVSEAIERLSSGMHVMIREGTGAKNLKTLVAVVNDKTAPRLMWCTDDRHPHDLMDQGSIDYIVREAIRMGVEPTTAIRIASLSPADYFGLKDRGAVAPGRRADLVVFEDLNNPVADLVFTAGKLVAKHGEMITGIEMPTPVAIPPSMNADASSLDFSIRAEGKRARAIEIVPDQLLTRQYIFEPVAVNGFVRSDIERDILKIAVVERHKRTGNIGKGFLKGLGLKRGAIASSVAHDSHNIVAAGVSGNDMAAAVREVIRMGGGLALACDGKPVESLELPIAGLMSREPVKIVRDKIDRLLKSSRELGAVLKDPFMTLSFLALPVIPELKLTDMGLVDVVKFEIVPLFTE